MGGVLESIYDWLSLIAFAGLIVLFLQRSSMENPPDRIIAYLPPAIGCALANYLGNEGYAIMAILLLVAVGAYVFFVLKPFSLR